MRAGGGKLMADDSGSVEKIKAQRDRFIAFAFAGADLLLEVGLDDRIVFSAGAGEALYGLSDSELIGRKLADFIFARDRRKYDDALLRLRNSGRLDHVPLTLTGTDGAVARMRLSGIRLPRTPNCYHLVLSRVPAMAQPEGERITSSEVDPKIRFIDMVRQRLNEANRVGQDYTLTLFDLSGTSLAGVEPNLAQSFLATLQHALEECSVRGASAGVLSGASFGLVHDTSMPAEKVRDRVAAITEKFSGRGGLPGVKMHSATLDLEDSELSDEDIGKALNYICTNFVRDSARFMMKSLAEGARLAVEDTLVRVRNFRRMVKGDDKLVFVFQPIVNIRTGAVLKYEAFARITHNGNFFLPQQIIPFATDVGLIGEFDLMAVTKAVAMLKEPGTLSALANVSVNISGQSLGNPGFYHSLMKLLESNRPVLGRLVLEVTEADKIYNLDEAKRLMTRLRKLGVRISLDDFGAGGAGLDLLRFLPVDFAKFDHNYMLEARDPKGRSVLKAMTSLCRDLDVVTIGECVEDAAMVKILADVGIDYAQGYFFARPAADAAKRIKYYHDQVRAAGTAEPGLGMAVG